MDVQRQLDINNNRFAAAQQPSREENGCQSCYGGIISIIGLAAIAIGICNLCPGAGALYHFTPPLASIGFIVGGFILAGPIANYVMKKDGGAALFTITCNC